MAQTPKGNGNGGNTSTTTGSNNGGDTSSNQFGTENNDSLGGSVQTFEIEEKKGEHATDEAVSAEVAVAGEGAGAGAAANTGAEVDDDLFGLDADFSAVSPKNGAKSPFAGIGTSADAFEDFLNS